MYGFIHKWFHNLFHHYSLSGSWMLLLIKEKKKKKEKKKNGISLQSAKWVALIIDDCLKNKPKTTVGACQWCPVSELQIASVNIASGSQVNCLPARAHLSQVTHLPGEPSTDLRSTPPWHTYIINVHIKGIPCLQHLMRFDSPTQPKPLVFRFDVL